MPVSARAICPGIWLDVLLLYPAVQGPRTRQCKVWAGSIECRVGALPGVQEGHSVLEDSRTL